MTSIRRGSSARWHVLATLLMGLERGIEGAARLDAYDANLDDDAGVSQAVHLRAEERFDQRLWTLGRRLDRELNRVTVERLTHDLAARIAHDEAILALEFEAVQAFGAPVSTGALSCA